MFDELTIEVTADPSLLADVHFHTTSIAYRSYFPPGSVHPTIQELALMWGERLLDQTACALAAWRSGEPVGAVVVRLDPDFDSEGQLLGLHVLPDRWGGGIGGALHDAALKTLKARHYAKGGLWVIADNARARRMYERRDWRLRQGIELDYLGVREVRYGRVF